MLDAVVTAFMVNLQVIKRAHMGPRQVMFGTSIHLLQALILSRVDVGRISPSMHRANG